MEAILALIVANVILILLVLSDRLAHRIVNASYYFKDVNFAPVMKELLTDLKVKRSAKLLITYASSENDVIVQYSDCPDEFLERKIRSFNKKRGVIKIELY